MHKIIMRLACHEPPLWQPKFTAAGLLHTTATLFCATSLGSQLPCHFRNLVDGRVTGSQHMVVHLL